MRPVFAVSQALIGTLSAASAEPSSDEILARLESENNRRHVLLKEYSGSRQYTRYTVLTRSGSDKLNGIIDMVLASETGASTPPENIRHEITSANYRVRLLGTEIAAGQTCYVLNLAPRVKNRFLIVGKVWVAAGSYAVVRIEGQFAGDSASLR
jgi:hypothetical protein